MVCHKKRGLSLAGSVFAFIAGIALALVNLLLVLDNVLDDKLGIMSIREIFADFGIVFETYEKIEWKYDWFSAMYAGLFFVGLFLIMLACKNFKDPIKKDGTVDYRRKTVWGTIILSIATAGLMFIIATELVTYLVSGNDMFVPFCYAILGVSALAFLFSFISLFINTKIVKVTEVIEEKKDQSPDIDTLFSVEKVKRINQLKDLGAITEKQYDEAVSKYSRGA